MNRSAVRSALAALLLAAGCVTAAPQPQPVYATPAPPPQQRHPAYLQALAELRHSRAHLQRPGSVTMATAWDENVAIREIDAAMRELHDAAIDDGRPLDDHPPIDPRLDWPGRLHRSLELLRAARGDCAREEDNGFARGMQGRAIQHIDGAIRYLEQGIAANYPHYQPPPPMYVAPAPPPPPPQQHPSYLHALSDLRDSRAHLERPAAVNMRTAWDENVAIREIDAAMHEIVVASIDDGKPLSDHPPVDSRLDWPGRLHRSLELLGQARHDCEQEEDNAFAQGLRARAIQHIDAAIRFIAQGMAANYPRYQPPAPVYVTPAPPPASGAHPAYLHALADLRHARAHLERPRVVNMRTAWDENVAIRQIDAAMHEIVVASIDDGKPLGDHPPVDGRLDWPGRLHRTADLLRSARHDCEQEEDNGFAQGLRVRALQRIDVALAFVEKGIRDNGF